MSKSDRRLVWVLEVYRDDRLKLSPSNLRNFKRTFSNFTDRYSKRRMKLENHFWHENYCGYMFYFVSAQCSCGSQLGKYVSKGSTSTNEIKSKKMMSSNTNPKDLLHWDLEERGSSGEFLCPCSSSRESKQKIHKSEDKQPLQGMKFFILFYHVFFNPWRNNRKRNGIHDWLIWK